MTFTFKSGSKNSCRLKAPLKEDGMASTYCIPSCGTVFLLFVLLTLQPPLCQVDCMEVKHLTDAVDRSAPSLDHVLTTRMQNIACMSLSQHHLYEQPCHSSCRKDRPKAHCLLASRGNGEQMMSR